MILFLNRRKFLKTGTACSAALTITSLSGCLGVLGSDDTDDNTGNRENNVGPEDSEGVPAYNWSEGESYKYQMAVGDQTAETTWTVVEADDTNVTMKVEEKGGPHGPDNDVEAEISGTNQNIYRLVVKNETVRGLLISMREHLRFVAGRDLSVGDSYTYEAKDSLDFRNWGIEVLSEETIKGIACYKISITVSDNEEYEDYANTLFIQKENNYPFAISEDVDNSGGGITTELVEATRP